jgi:PIN domain nuclease of toxin-antitoxin system
LAGTTPEGLLRAALESGLEHLDLGAEDVATSHMLPFVEENRNPFDRLLAWQCIGNELTLLTSDRAMHGYRRHGLELAI